MLAVLNKDQIAHAMFPLGDTPKSEVREEARSRGLLVADKPDSHDVCFIADGDTRGFLSRKLGSAPGAIVDQDGAVLGAHEGVHGFTIGQRKGLHLDRPAPDGNPRYVLSIEPVSNTVTVGPADALGVREITAIRPVWTGCEPPFSPIECTVQLRAHGEVHPCTAQVSGDELHIYLTRPGPGRGRGPGRRPLRRRHGPGQRHHLGYPLSRGEPPSSYPLPESRRRQHRLRLPGGHFFCLRSAGDQRAAMITPGMSRMPVRLDAGGQFVGGPAGLFESLWPPGQKGYVPVGHRDVRSVPGAHRAGGLRHRRELSGTRRPAASTAPRRGTIPGVGRSSGFRWERPACVPCRGRQRGSRPSAARLAASGPVPSPARSRRYPPAERVHERHDPHPADR